MPETLNVPVTRTAVNGDNRAGQVGIDRDNRPHSCGGPIRRARSPAAHGGLRRISHSMRRTNKAAEPEI